MSTRRRVGFNTSSSEASRRQLMQPVPCWEKVWAVPENAPPGTTLKVYRWVKTDKKQHFSDDEGEDQTLAPLPDEPEVVDGDDDMDQDEATNSVVPDTTPASREVTEPPMLKEDSKPTSPKPHPLSISFQPATPTELDASLQPSESGLDVGDMGGDMTLSMDHIGPDGEPFEEADDLTQLQAADALLGGPLIDQSMDDDPFVVPE